VKRQHLLLLDQPLAFAFDQSPPLLQNAVNFSPRRHVLRAAFNQANHRVQLRAHFGNVGL